MAATGIHGGASSGSGSTTITNPLGQDTMAASVAVVIASDQSAVPVSGTVTASGPLTNTELRAAPVIISGAVVTI